MTPSLKERIEEAATAHMTEDFNNNPDGYAVAPYMNEYTRYDSFEQGAHFALKLLMESEEMKGVEKEGERKVLWEQFVRYHGQSAVLNLIVLAAGLTVILLTAYFMRV